MDQYGGPELSGVIVTALTSSSRSSLHELTFVRFVGFMVGNRGLPHSARRHGGAAVVPQFHLFALTAQFERLDHLPIF